MARTEREGGLAVATLGAVGDGGREGGAMQVAVELVLRSLEVVAEVTGEVEADRFGHLTVREVRAVVGGEVVGLRPKELFDAGCQLRTAFRARAAEAEREAA